MALFSRRPQEGTPSQAASSIPDYGFNLPESNAGQSLSHVSRSDPIKQSSYPQDMGGRARFTGRARTSSYVQSSVYNRRTYDTIN